jgi:hypothetical protein
MSLKNSEILSKLFKEYNLHYDPTNPNSKDNDVYAHKHYKIITRSGIDKIEKAAGITTSITPIFANENCVIVKMNGSRMVGDEKKVEAETLASASAETSQNKYFAEMAEKRGRSRIVLKLAGLYELGIYGEDEADDFGKIVKEARGGESVGAKYKGE